MTASLPAGAELDVAIAIKVMGWAWVPPGSIDKKPYSSFFMFNGTSRMRSDWEPSTNIAHAFEVVEKTADVVWGIERVPGEGWRATAWPKHDDYPVCTWAETAPLAICRTALDLLAAGGGQ